MLLFAVAELAVQPFAHVNSELHKRSVDDLHGDTDCHDGPLSVGTCTVAVNGCHG
jgi:hypothetical protein